MDRRLQKYFEKENNKIYKPLNCVNLVYYEFILLERSNISTSNILTFVFLSFSTVSCWTLYKIILQVCCYIK